MAGLQALVQHDDPGLHIAEPKIGEVYALAPGQPARRTHTGRTDLDQLAGTDWQNDYADFVSNLKVHLGKIGNERARKAALAEMRRVLDSCNAVRTERRRRTPHR